MKFLGNVPMSNKSTSENVRHVTVLILGFLSSCQSVAYTNYRSEMHPTELTNSRNKGIRRTVRLKTSFKIRVGSRFGSSLGQGPAADQPAQDTFVGAVPAMPLAPVCSASLVVPYC